MTNRDLIQAWLDKAASDLRNAEIVLASGNNDLPTDTVCFHCQQAAEKYLKAFLTSRNTPFPPSHNLSDLIAIAAKVNPDFALILEKAESLSPYAVSIRYPDDYWMPTLSEAQEALATAREIKQFILQRLNPKR